MEPKKGYVILAILLLTTPVILEHLLPKKFGNLSGVVAKKPAVGNNWWSGTWQQQMEQNFRDSSKLAPLSIHVKNQLEFSLFNKINAGDLYHHGGVFFRYTYARYNETHDFVGLDTIKHRVQLLKQFQEETKKPVYVLIAPNKMRFFQEKLPDVNRIHSNQTNYYQYKKELQKAGIPLLDAQSWLFGIKNQLPHPVFARQGVHWTEYAAGLAFDSLIKRVSKDQHTSFQRLKPSWKPKGNFFAEDIDLANLCNLIFTPIDPNLISATYPTKNVKKKKLRIMLLSDSFFHVVSWSGMDRQILDSNSTFYFYYHTRFDQQFNFNKVNHNQIKKDLEGIDCLILLSDIQNLSNFGFGFLDDYAKKQLGHFDSAQ